MLAILVDICSDRPMHARSASSMNTSIQPPGLMMMRLSPSDHHHEHQALPQEGGNSP